MLDVLDYGLHNVTVRKVNALAWFARVIIFKKDKPYGIRSYTNDGKGNFSYTFEFDSIEAQMKLFDDQKNRFIARTEMRGSTLNAETNFDAFHNLGFVVKRSHETIYEQAYEDQHAYRVMRTSNQMKVEYERIDPFASDDY